MKKYLLIFLLIGLNATGQDYIITWKNDTIACKLSSNPKKMGLKSPWQYQNGYQRIVSEFAKDSLRVINAGEIKGYSRKVHGKKLLCNGVFEAKQLIPFNQREITFVENGLLNKSKPWNFVNRIVHGKYASLYLLYEYRRSSPAASYYLVRHGIEAPNTAIAVYSKKKLLALLKVAAIAPEMDNINYRKSAKGFIDIINGYNLLKEATLE